MNKVYSNINLCTNVVISGRGAAWKRIPHRYAGVLGDDKSEIKSFACDAEIREENRGVAQPGSAPALGAGCRRFKSSRPDQ